MKKLLLTVLALALSLTVVAGCGKKADTIVVGGKDYTEQDLLGNILTVLLDENTDLEVVYKNEMSSNVIFAAVQSGDVDVLIDYTGTIYGNYLNYLDIRSADEVYDISAREMEEKFELKLLEPLGFNNTYCLAVRPETAEKYNLKTYSDLAKVSDELVFGGGFEILNRNDGIPNLKKTYEMTFKDEVAVDGVLRYSSIESDETQITEAFSTDGMLLAYDLVVLEDDKNFFPPYHAVPVIRMDTAQEHPEVVEQLGRLANFISDDTMRGLNHRIDVLKENPRDVAIDFLRTSGLID